ncbi:hypothetical protein SAY86_012590 [Trapa natans]|uniref:Clp R domain-containing protein n=1 Tax=Trapa natans TaxID=22666 RepID=A0AAN7RBQ3_TRANT|nr:hypothetical protein SAY86_012590 [Trapa natans]
MASQSVFNLSPATPLLRTRSTRRSSQPSVVVFHSSFLGAETLSIHSSNLNPDSQLTRRRPFCATVSLSLPSSNPDRAAAASSDKIPKWSRRAIKSFAMGELEARKLKYPTTGTEALLMGLLIEGTSSAAKFLLANGITIFKVREESKNLLGKGDLYFFSPEHPPLTEDAQRALDCAFDLKLKSGDGGEITTRHLLLGVWSQADSPGHKILSALGFNNDKANELILSIQEPGSKS